jgi:membrane-bound lytic murein transglycosylase C
MQRRARLLALLLGVTLGAGCATSQVVEQNLKQVAHGQSPDTSGYPDALNADRIRLAKELEVLQKRFAEEVTTLRAKAQKRWGQGARVADKTVYVKYSQGYNSRVITDFDQGTLTVETRVMNDPQGSLRKAIIAALLTGSDPAAVDLFTDKEVVVDPAHRPYLYGLIHDNQGNSVGTRKQAEDYATYLMANRAKTRPIAAKEGGGMAWFVTLTMVKNFEARGEERYRGSVDRYAAQYHVSPSLVLAIMRTESNFNPFAVSGAPAYGLMQLVPTSGGLAAQIRVTGKKDVPSTDFLLDPEHNIEYGVAYLSVLNTDEFSAVTNQNSRDYCVIAAYNIGPGNVTNVFASKRKAALDAINSEQPAQLFDHLHKDLPAQETRDYIVRVTNHRKEFVTATGAAATTVPSPTPMPAPAAAPAPAPAPRTAPIAGH